MVREADFLECSKDISCVTDLRVCYTFESDSYGD